MASGIKTEAVEVGLLRAYIFNSPGSGECSGCEADFRIFFITKEIGSIEKSGRNAYMKHNIIEYTEVFPVNHLEDEIQQGTV
jgi:hypothetical protein